MAVTVLDVPAPPVADDVNLPGPGTATLIASGSGITWYDAPTGGSPVGSGSPWETPFLNGTTSFWCTSASTNGAVPAFGAKTDNTTSGQYHTNSTNYQLFTANQLFVIRSVKVYANSAGNRTIALVDGSGNTVQQGVFNVPNGESRVQLNFTVPGPGQYGLRLVGNTVGLWRDGLGSAQSYPYPLGGFGSMTSSTATGSSATSYYYFFYDWEVSLPLVRCESAREEVVVSLPTGVADAGAGGLRIFPNPADRDLFVDAEGPSAFGRLVFVAFDATGREVARKPILNGRATVTTAFLAPGVYAYRVQRDAETLFSGRFLVEHLW